MQELYPTLVLYPAENKTGIFYEGDMSVINIMEFLESHGSNSHYLTKHKGRYRILLSLSVFTL